MSALVSLSGGSGPVRGRLVVFPHAGGSPRFYRHWAQALPAVHLIGALYAGRDSRLHDPFPASVAEMAAETAHELLGGRPGRPRAVPVTRFGHSFGALVAYQTGLELSRLGSPPDLLVVSGHDAPTHAPLLPEPDLADEELLADLFRLDPRNRLVFSDPDLRRIFLPAVRSDYRLAHSYRLPAEVRPLPRAAVINGARDTETTRQGSLRWGCLAHRFDGVRLVPGGHFHLARPQLSCALAVRTLLERLTPPPARAAEIHHDCPHNGRRAM